MAGEPIEITMPRLSDSMQDGTILTWLKTAGEQVQKGDELLEIETDKATMAYESPAAGRLTIIAQAGETLPVGAVIATLGEAAKSAPAPHPEPHPAPHAEPHPAPHAEPDPEPHAEPEREPVTLPASAGNGAAPATVRATPLARRLAHAHGVDLTALHGTGPRGRITRSDVAAHAKIPDPVPVAPASAPPLHAPKSETVALTRTQQLIARRMSESKATIPHFQVQTDARMDALLKLRADLKAITDDDQPVPSINDFIVKAAALALRAHPRANGSYRDGQFELHAGVNVGIAVAAPDALVVATIADADKRPLRTIAADARRLAQRVRDQTITPPELSNATFTVSNLGMYGMTQITPVINPPQAAILGVGALRPVPALDDGQLTEHQHLTLTLSCDHRILYGADAAQFLADIRARLQTPLGLLL
jgi:pyruvate dehydrogenase E2 component (dihydrolipoamide acetyltransferase)